MYGPIPIIWQPLYPYPMCQPSLPHSPYLIYLPFPMCQTLPYPIKLLTSPSSSLFLPPPFILFCSPFSFPVLPPFLGSILAGELLLNQNGGHTFLSKSWTVNEFGSPYLIFYPISHVPNSPLSN
ncbi:hypothetical protein XELAEV_18032748mg [Xenopus laevis]|uniref:Uncharacterized protein n=1 Tax=Xenopus laevis TaxID=8355 RepID=A0A974CHZ7_XENLA|nr:hypothetical protein XELAEV_18032748mg [Xenopus laevis]